VTDRQTDRYLATKKTAQRRIGRQEPSYKHIHATASIAAANNCALSNCAYSWQPWASECPDVKNYKRRSGTGSVWQQWASKG